MLPYAGYILLPTADMAAALVSAKTYSPLK